MTTDNKPYWEQDIAECLRVAAEIIGPNSYYLRAAEYIDGMRERLASLQSECEERRKDAVNLTEKVIPNLRDRISKLEGSIVALESECNQLNDLSIKHREIIDNLASMCRRLSYSVKRSGNDKLAHECVELLKKYDLGGSVLRNMEGPADLCPKPAPGLEIDDRGVLVRKKDKDDMQKEYDIYKKWTKIPKGDSMTTDAKNRPGTPLEWNGSCAPEAPDSWWIDDVTGEYINAETGERMTAREGRRQILRQKGEL